MRDGEFAIVKEIRSRREESHLTQAARQHTARIFIQTLSENGYSRDVKKADFAIKERHVLRAVEAWHESGIADRTIANRLSHIRRFCEYQGRPGMVKRTMITACRAGTRAASGSLTRRCPRYRRRR